MSVEGVLYYLTQTNYMLIASKNDTTYDFYRDKNCTNPPSALRSILIWTSVLGLLTVLLFQCAGRYIIENIIAMSIATV